MNKILEEFSRKTLKEGLATLPESNRLLFKRMYANGNLEMDINECIEKMSIEKLDWAMQQVQRTLDKGRVL